MASIRMTHARAEVLLCLARGPAWGYRISEATGLGAGTLYPILHAFEQRGLVKVERRDELRSDGRSVGRKYYRLTPAGESLLPAARTKVTWSERTAWSPA